MFPLSSLLNLPALPAKFQKSTSENLVFPIALLKIKIFLAKTSDVPTYVEYGAADIGVVGKDTILEENRNVYEMLDLGLGKCRMCVAGLPEMRDRLGKLHSLRVATKYPNIAREYFYHKKHKTVEIIKLNGSIELAPIVGLSDCIVDIVESGATLRENGLVVFEEICPLSARVIVNRVSMKMEHQRIIDVMDRIRYILRSGINDTNY